MHESALIIEVPEVDPVVEHWRRDHDPIASHGIPPHITALYPFIEPRKITEADAVRVRDIVAEMQPWSFELTSVQEFPGVVWLQPEPTDPFRALTRRLWDAFPEFPPFGGRYADLVPHVTIAQLPPQDDQAALVSRIVADIGSSFPIACRATALALYVSTRRDRRWQCTHRFPFSEQRTAP